MFNVASLRAAISAGQSFDYLLFWGHRGRADGRMTPHCLSQWYPAPFRGPGGKYATAEHWMMAGKARLFGDDEAARQILRSDDPNIAKKIGRKVKDFDDTVWKKHRYEIVVEGSVLKFGKNRHTPIISARHERQDTGWGKPDGYDLGDRRWKGRSACNSAFRMAGRKSLRLCANGGADNLARTTKMSFRSLEFAVFQPCVFRQVMAEAV